MLRQMASKVKTMRFTLGTLTILFTVVLVGCSCAMMLNAYQNTQAEEKWPFDVAVYSENVTYDFSKEKKLIEKEGNIEDLHTYQIYENGSNQMNLLFLDQVKGAYESGYFKYDTYMKLSDYNRLRQMLGYQPAVLLENQYLIHTKSRIKNMVEDISRQGLKVNKRTLSCQGVYTEPLEQNGHNGSDYLLVVSDETAGNMTPYYNLLMAQMKGPVPDTLQDELLAIQGFESGMDVDYTYEDRGTGTDMIYSDNSPVYVKETSTQDMRFLLSAIIFPLFYIGLVFICVAMTILAVQQISDSDKYRFRYQVLKNLGLRKDEINKIILKQLMIYYLVPFAAAVLISVGIVAFIGRQFVFYSGITAASASFFAWSLFFFGIIYLIYFAVTYEEVKRNGTGS